MIQPAKLHGLVERLRIGAIGEPQWIADKAVFEYTDHSPKVVAVLKLVRAAQGVSALHLLCRAGLFIDLGASIRCINDCTEEVYFLLEEFPRASPNVEKFVKAFFEGTIDGYFTGETPPIPSTKIRAAVVRILKGGQDEAVRLALERIYNAFCGYVHASYACIMEIYNGGEQDFSLEGVSSVEERLKRMHHVETTSESVLHATAFVAQRLDLKDVLLDIMKAFA